MPPESLKAVYAPVRVGTPPGNACRGLERMPDGEIRFYPTGGPSHRTEGVYAASRDEGLTWQTYPLDPDDPGPCIRHPRTGERVAAVLRDRVLEYRRYGATGTPRVSRIGSGYSFYPRHPLFLRRRNRVVVAVHTAHLPDEDDIWRLHVWISDDEGDHWRRTLNVVGPKHEAVWPHENVRWQNYYAEPSVTELNDGRLWMLLRTAMDEHYETFSHDGGETWETPRPSIFYATITMPLVQRLADGRVLCLWNNATPLPEIRRGPEEGLPETATNGYWEDVFTNRDVLHAAISEDDGRTWIGFRELYVNPTRNDRDYAVAGGIADSLDRSVHQTQVLEVAHGKLLVALGQHPRVRSFLLFDPAWLYETGREARFRDGLGDWCTFKYYPGVKGHDAYNRDPGPELILHPDDRDDCALRLARPHRPDLLCDLDGAVWNFPAARRGTLRVRLRWERAGAGLQICLVNRWFNPTDPVVRHFANYVLTIPEDSRMLLEQPLEAGRWMDVEFRWPDSSSTACEVLVDGVPVGTLPLLHAACTGISYLHLQAVAAAPRPDGVLVDRVFTRRT